MFKRRVRRSNACLATLFAFLLGACAMGFLVTPPLSDSRALRLPDDFAISADTNTSNDYIAFFVGNDDLVWGEVAVPPEAYKDFVITAIYYTDLAGDRLMKANLSAKDGWHKFEVRDWSDKVVAYIDSEDGGERWLFITDQSGAVMALGQRSIFQGKYDMHSPDGVLLATIFDAGGGNWSVAVAHCSKISKAIYALIAGYNTVVSTGRVPR